MKDCKMSEPVSSATVGEKITATALGAGGISLPVWIQYFQQYAQVAITSIYLILALVALYTKIIKPLFKKDKKDE